MLAEHSYIKPRYQFGKQCLFAYEESVAAENIWPDPELTGNFVLRTERNRHAQIATQYAAHEVQTTKQGVKTTGTLHMEGGWPKEINPTDAENVLRYRRRVERNDSWVLTMRELMPPMEHSVMQNNAVNIYQNYFDDVVPTSIIRNYDIRIRNAYMDPQQPKRPIKHISWSPHPSNRLAAAYWFAEFDKQPPNANQYSYVWDIENPVLPLTALKASSPLVTVEFNPRDPSLLIGGLVSGQVCTWDIRRSDEAAQVSHPLVSHQHPANQALWINSKANAEFFSASTNGVVMWWDTRFMKKPTDTLVMDIDDPARADVDRAVGVTVLQYEHTISSRFLAGTKNGMVVNVNRRGNTPAEKLAMRFKSCTGPIISIDRNPAFPKNFLTVGDWTAKVWAEDTREGCLLRSRDELVDLSGGCWSRSRCSVFFTINTEGSVEAYDILTGVQAPFTSIHISTHSLTAISSNDVGEYLAVGNSNGDLYLLECAEGLTTFTKNDKALLSAYFERGHRFEKLVDQRMKELRLLYGSSDDEPAPRVRKRGSIAKDKRMENKDKKKAKSVIDEKRKQKSGNEEKRKRTSLGGEKERRESLKMPKRRRSKRKTSVTGDPVFAAIEENYFRTIEAESAKFVELDAADVEAAQELLRQRIVQPPKVQESDKETDDSTKDRKSTASRRMTSRTRSRMTMRRRLLQRSGEVEVEQEPVLEDDPERASRLTPKKRAARILRKTCLEVCKPEICCKDIAEKRRAERSQRLAVKLAQAEEAPGTGKPFYMDEQWYQRLSANVTKVSEAPRAMKAKMLLLKKLPPSVLREELRRAKQVVRDWQERAIAGKLCARPFVEEPPRPVTPKPKPEADQEVAKQVSVADVKKSAVAKQETRFKARSPSGRSARKNRRRKTKISPEEIKRKKQQEWEELWRMLKRKVKEQEPREEETYPRISAAFARTSSEDLVHPPAK
ncbi:dynein intermediate chain 3, ciliary-like [Andrena cerasifolii]|uniref:dynein intermediate chain 3, ciliary-like n=1 Tax=Andrena cerasifolii TaxID=2819439 RepID=UPI0040378AAF